MRTGDLILVNNQVHYQFPEEQPLVCIYEEKSSSYIVARTDIYLDPVGTAKCFTEAHPVVMFKNDCVVTTGKTLLQAFDRLEVMESTAHSIINSLTLGPIVHITDEEVDDLKKAFALVD